MIGFIIYTDIKILNTLGRIHKSKKYKFQKVGVLWDKKSKV